MTHVIMQGDGNLVIYNDKILVWSSDTGSVANNGGCFKIDLNDWSGGIFRANGTVARSLFSGSVSVVIDEAPVMTSTPSGTTPVVLSDPTTIHGTIDTSNVTLTGGRPLAFPRQQGWEAKLCTALGIPGVPADYKSMTPFQQVPGSMGLEAAEAYFQARKKMFSNPQEAITSLSLDLSRQQADAVAGVLGALIINKLKENKSDVQSNALRDWATQVYRKIKVDAAVGTLKEYKKWKTNPCAYPAPGYQKPRDCYTANTIYAQLFKTNKPPLDLLTKAGLMYAAGYDNRLVQQIAAAVGAVGLVAGFIAGATGIGVATGTMNVSTGLPILTTLFSAFGGSGGAAGAAAGAIGASGWAGVAGGPAAVIVTAAVIGISQGVVVIEGEQAENRLKQAVNVAVKEHLNMANILGDEKGAGLFMIGLVKSAQNGRQAPPLDIEGEVTFFCEAGYVSKFYLTYTQNGQPKSFATRELSAGFSAAFTLPANAKNIVAKGMMVSAGERQVFSETIGQPTYICYKTYGTVFQQAWNNDWPLSVGGELSGTANKVKFFHQAGYVANFLIEYNEPGKATKTTYNPKGKTAGWTDTHTIPANATNVRILIQGATGLAMAFDQKQKRKTAVMRELV